MQRTGTMFIFPFQLAAPSLLGKIEWSQAICVCFCLFGSLPVGDSHQIWLFSQGFASVLSTSAWPSPLVSLGLLERKREGDQSASVVYAWSTACACGGGWTSNILRAAKGILGRLLLVARLIKIGVPTIAQICHFTCCLESSAMRLIRDWQIMSAYVCLAAFDSVRCDSWLRIWQKGTRFTETRWNAHTHTEYQLARVVKANQIRNLNRLNRL